MAAQTCWAVARLWFKYRKQWNDNTNDLVNAVLTIQHRCSGKMYLGYKTGMTNAGVMSYYSAAIGGTCVYHLDSLPEYAVACRISRLMYGFQF